MPIFKVSKQAEDDLIKIAEYTEDNWGIEKRNQYLDDIDQSFHLLAANSEYPIVKDIGHIKEGCFSLLVNKYIIIFRKHSYGIRIVCVLGQPMNIGLHL